MKKAFKGLMPAALAAMLVFAGCTSASASGYSVLMQPEINVVDGTAEGKSYNGESYQTETYFYPTPFRKGYSVVHNNVRIMPGMEAEYYDKSSYVVDAHGNKTDLGNYDCFGVYSFGLGYNPSEYYEGYMNPAFDPYDGVDIGGYITVVKGGKGGLIDVQGNVVIPCEYDSLTEVYSQYNVNWDSEDDIKPYTGKYFAPYSDPYYYFEYDHDYYNGLAVVAETNNENSKVGIVDENDNVIVPFVYDMITPCYDKECWVLKDGKWGIITVDNRPVHVTADGKNVEFDQIPLIINGRTLAPVRAILESIGAVVAWDGATRTVTAERDGITVSMTIGQNVMYKNGEAVELEEAPQIIMGRTLIPVRAIAEGFDCSAGWDDETKTVMITSK